MLRKLSLLVLGSTFVTESYAALKVDPYGSVRVQLESVKVAQAKAGEQDAYTGLRDVYSRFGLKASYPLTNGTTIDAQVEIPFNSVRLKFEDPSFFEGFYRHNSDPRLAKLSASGDWGSVSAGKQWLVYYNNVAAKVDYFSSFYAGFATHASFRRDALSYNSPDFSGLRFAVAAVDRVDDANTAYLDSMQYALSYSNQGLSLSLGLEDRSKEAGSVNTFGMAAAYTAGPWHFAAKLETLENLAVAEQTIKNLYTSYNQGKYIFKAHYAVGDEVSGGGAFFIGDSLHLGLDYQHSRELKLFAEYFTESHGYAVYTPNSESFSPLAGYQAKQRGHAFVLGGRYDF